VVRIAWVMKIGAEGEGPARDVLQINWLGDLADIADLGPLFAPLNGFAGRRSAGGVLESESETVLSCRPRPYME
jgi:hypothetical protein